MMQRTIPGIQKHPSFLTSNISNLHRFDCHKLNESLTKQKSRCISIRASNDFPARGEEGEIKGNPKVQDTLVQIIQLEKAKLKVAEIVEEEKQNLRDITERVSKKYEREYNIEKERTLKELEEAGQRVMEKVDLDCSEIEEVLAKTQRDIEAREKEFQEVEDRILASKSFYQKPLSVDALRSIKLEQRKLQDVTEEAAQNPFRFAMFLVLAVLVGLSLMESLGAEDVNWLSVTAFSLILFAIFARLYKETS